MPDLRPFIISTKDCIPGGADVLDRSTKRRIGYVLQDFYGRWEAYSEATRSPLGTGKRRYRVVAAWDVWDRCGSTVIVSIEVNADQAIEQLGRAVAAARKVRRQWRMKHERPLIAAGRRVAS